MEKFIGRCLKCLLMQTFSDFEIICVDDGSKDRTKDIIYSQMVKDPRIKFYKQENCGAGSARNKGYQHACGEYVLFLDADDLYEHKLLQTVYDEILENHCDIIVYASDRINYLTGKYVCANWTIKKELFPEKIPFDYREVKYPRFRCFIWWGWDKVYKKRFIDENCLFHQEISSTNDLFFNMSAFICAEKISVLDQVLAHHTFNNMDSVSNNRYLHPENCLKALQNIYIFLKEEEIYDYLKEDFVTYVKDFLNWNLKSLPNDSREALEKQLKTNYKNLMICNL